MYMWGLILRSVFVIAYKNVVRPKRTVQTDDIHTQLYIRLYIVRVDYVYYVRIYMMII